MPSVGVEFVTKMGVHMPQFVESTVEMHTSMYHESALNARITMENNEVKLSIPAPQGTTRLFSIWYKTQNAFIYAQFYMEFTLEKKKVLKGEKQILLYFS